MSRKSNWPSALSLFLAEKREAEFVWGENDCCLFTCDWLAILTGEYPQIGTELRGTYTTALGATRVLNKHGGVEQIAEAYCTAKEWPEVPVAFAQRGDIATIETPAGIAIGVVVGAQVVFPAERGTATVPLANARRAWRIR